MAHPWWQFSVRFNVAVSQSVPVVRMHERESEGVMTRWGLVPPSAKGDVAQGGCACVRGDAIVNSEDCRTAWLYGQRGIVPLAGSLNTLGQRANFTGSVAGDTCVPGRRRGWRAALGCSCALCNTSPPTER